MNGASRERDRSRKWGGPLSETCLERQPGPMTGPQHSPVSDRSDADGVEQRARRQGDARPGPPGGSPGGAVASTCHTRRSARAPRLEKAPRVPGPADRGPGRRGGPAPHRRHRSPRPCRCAHPRIDHVRCSAPGQETEPQLRALTTHGIPQGKICIDKVRLPGICAPARAGEAAAGVLRRDGGERAGGSTSRPTRKRLETAARKGMHDGPPLAVTEPWLPAGRRSPTSGRSWGAVMRTAAAATPSEVAVRPG